MISLIPMAGGGNRFFQERYDIPKPLILVMNSPMFVLSIKSFPVPDKYIFICLREHCEKYNLERLIKDNFKKYEIVIVDKVTEGPASSCLLAEDKLDMNDGLFIASCDYQMVYNEEKYERLLNDRKIDVIIWTFKIGSVKKESSEMFAYCRTDGERVTEVVEKRLISKTPYLDQAVVGSFTYKKAELFIRGARKMINKNIRINNEFYVGTSINQLIEEGYNVVAFEIDKFISFGTPFELMYMQYWEDYFSKLQGHPYSATYGSKMVTR
jgi:NDP-sugar pyrophosphorylase family protein